MSINKSILRALTPYYKESLKNLNMENKIYSCFLRFQDAQFLFHTPFLRFLQAGITVKGLNQSWKG